MDGRDKGGADARWYAAGEEECVQQLAKQWCQDPDLLRVLKAGGSKPKQFGRPASPARSLAIGELGQCSLNLRLRNNLIEVTIHASCAGRRSW